MGHYAAEIDGTGPMTKPFDVSTLLETEPLNDDQTYAPTRPRTSKISLPGGPVHIQDSPGSASGPTHHQPTGETPDIPEDAINPAHYRKHPSGIECIEVTRHMNFNTGNAIKYIWRYLDKGDPVENLKKAQWYLDDEIRRLEGKR
jgi:hypothetical protein